MTISRADKVTAGLLSRTCPEGICTIQMLHEPQILVMDLVALAEAMDKAPHILQRAPSDDISVNNA